MPKTRLTQTKRDEIVRYMIARYDEKRIGCERDRCGLALVAKINKLIRARFPESDVAVFRKYEYAGRPSPLRFSEPDSGRVVGLDLRERHEMREALADVPYHYSYATALEVTPEIVAEVDAYELLSAAEGKARAAALAEYAAFVGSCRTVEDVEKVVALPESLRAGLGATGRQLVAVNPETVERLREQFADAA